MLRRMRLCTHVITRDAVVSSAQSSDLMKQNRIFKIGAQVNVFPSKEGRFVIHGVAGAGARSDWCARMFEFHDALVGTNTSRLPMVNSTPRGWAYRVSQAPSTLARSTFSTLRPR